MDRTIVATGLGFPEGPAIDSAGVLHVVELATRRISRILEGEAVPWVSLPGAPNGLAFAPDGVLYACDNGAHWPPYPSTGGMPGPGDQPGRIWRITPEGTTEILVETIDDRPLNGPNDLCFDDFGGLYFTDPTWSPGADGRRVGDLCYLAPDGSASRIHSGLQFPNGLHVTPDGAALLVGETDTSVIHRFPILRPGVLGQPADYAQTGAGTSPDGMCLDTTGRLLVTLSTGGRTLVVAPGGDSIEGLIPSEDPCPTNACFGGDDMRTLFITEGGHGRVISIEWDVPGMTLFPDRGVHPRTRGVGR